MKNCAVIVLFLIGILLGCKTTNQPDVNPNMALAAKNDTIRIANDSLQYEVIIIDPGFSYWLISKSYPRNYYSQSYLENKNQIYITEWNNRVLQPQRFDPNLYEMSIDYDSFINYGYEVNYLIYNYMIYFQNTYRQKLSGYVPPR